MHTVLTILVTRCIVYWANVGRPHKDLQLGTLFSMAATVTICLLWTIPMTFFSGLSSVEGLKEQFDFVADMIDAVPILEPILQLLAPFFVVIFNALYVMMNLRLRCMHVRPTTNALPYSLLCQQTSNYFEVCVIV
jgi:hypothetical protein